MKRLLLAGLVMMVLGGGSVYGMDDGGGVSATRYIPDPVPGDDISNIHISVNTHKSNYVDEKIPGTQIAVLARKFHRCTTWNDGLKIIKKEYLDELKKSETVFRPWLKALKQELQCLVGGQFVSIEITVSMQSRSDIRYTLYPTEKDSTTQYVKPTVGAKKSASDLGSRALATSERKRASSAKKESKDPKPVDDTDDVPELIDAMGSLALTETDMKMAADEKRGEADRAKLAAISIEISEMRLMLRDLLDQSKSGKTIQRQEAQDLIEGIEALDDKGSIKVAEIVTERGFDGLVRIILVSDRFRQLILELIPYSESKKGLLSKKAKYVVNGFLYFAKLRKEEQNIRAITKNNIELLKVLAFIAFLSKHKDRCTRRILNLCYASDPAYARNVLAACPVLYKTLHPEPTSVPKARCCKSWCGPKNTTMTNVSARQSCCCCCKSNTEVGTRAPKKRSSWCAEPLDHFLSVAYCAGIACFYYCTQHVGTAPEAGGWWWA